MTPTTSAAPITFHVVPDTEELGRVTLRVDPLPRVCPDGATLEVQVFTDSRSDWRGDHPVRVASVSLVDADGKRGAGSGASVRFAGTLAAPSAWGRVEESTRYDRTDTGETYWRCTSSTAWRADGFATDLPDGARRAFFDVITAAAEHVAERMPYLWAGAAEKSARKRVADAESAVKTARAELADAKKSLRAAERAHERAERAHERANG